MEEDHHVVSLKFTHRYVHEIRLNIGPNMIQGHIEFTHPANMLQVNYAMLDGTNPHWTAYTWAVGLKVGNEIT